MNIGCIVATTSVAENSISDVIAQMDIITLIIGIAILILIICICCFRLCHRTIFSCANGADIPDYFALVRYIHSVTDFWTDIFLCYALYISQKWNLFYASLIFTIIPLLCSIILVIYWIHRWRSFGKQIYSISHRLVDYLDSYAIALGFLSIMGDFPTTIWLLQSRLFYANIFNLSLKKKEFQTLIAWRFINVTLLEVKYKKAKQESNAHT